MYNKKMDAKQIGLYALGAFALYQVFRLFKVSAAAVQAKAAEVVVTNQTGIQGPELDLTKEVATAVYDAIYNYAGGFMEDEEQVATQLNRLTTATQARAVSIIYSTMPKGRSLKDDVRKYLQGDQLTAIKQIIRGALL